MNDITRAQANDAAITPSLLVLPQSTPEVRKFPCLACCEMMTDPLDDHFPVDHEPIFKVSN
jgi:hypothetical protein